MMDELLQISMMVRELSLPYFWGILGIILIVLEMVVMGSFLLWLGLSALVTGIIVYFVVMSFSMTWLLFAALSLVMLFSTRKAYKNFFQFTSNGMLNRRGEDLIGRGFILDEPILNGRGRLRIGDSMWAIKGDDMEIGTPVIVTAIDGNHLVVQRAEYE